MSTLHTISKAPSARLLASCLGALTEDDAILFIEDGVYYCLESELLTAIPATVSVYGLREDLAARGVMDKRLPRMALVCYRDFVELSIAHDKTLGWF